MADTSVIIDSGLLGGQRAGTFGFTFVATDVDQGTLISNQTDFVDSMVVTIGAGIGSDGQGPQSPGYSGFLSPGRIFFNPSNAGPGLRSNTVLEAGVEYCVVITFDETSASIYIDGVLDHTKSGDFSIPAHGGSVAAIGTWLGHGLEQLRPFSGTIGQTVLFDQALDAVDAAALSAGESIGVDSSYSCSDDGFGNHKIVGSFADDILFGATGNDTLSGQGGRDQLEGSSGRDRLFGGTGADDLLGGAGADDLTGGKGADNLFGGLGADVFHFARARDAQPGRNRDTVHDFEAGTDLIDLSALADLIFMGSGDFSGLAGEIRVDAAKGVIRIDVDGDRSVDAAIAVQIGTTLTGADFVL